MRARACGVSLAFRASDSHWHQPTHALRHPSRHHSLRWDRGTPARTTGSLQPWHGHDAGIKMSKLAAWPCRSVSACRTGSRRCKLTTAGACPSYSSLPRALAHHIPQGHGCGDAFAGMVRGRGLTSSAAPLSVARVGMQQSCSRKRASLDASGNEVIGTEYEVIAEQRDMCASESALTLPNPVAPRAACPGAPAQGCEALHPGAGCNALGWDRMRALMCDLGRANTTARRSPDSARGGARSPGENAYSPGPCTPYSAASGLGPG